MGKRKRHSAEQIVKKLRDADAMLASGKSVGEVLQTLEVSDGGCVLRRTGSRVSRKTCPVEDGRLGSRRITPAGSSWLNLIERWFRDLTDKGIRRR